MVTRGQVGTEKKLDLVERGYITTGGSFSETLLKAETVIITNA